MAKKRAAVWDMCLCKRCEDNFRDGGYRLVRKGGQINKAGCDYCNTGRGYTFGIFASHRKAI